MATAVAIVVGALVVAAIVAATGDDGGGSRAVVAADSDAAADPATPACAGSTTGTTPCEIPGTTVDTTADTTAPTTAPDADATTATETCGDPVDHAGRTASIAHDGHTYELAWLTGADARAAIFSPADSEIDAFVTVRVDGVSGTGLGWPADRVAADHLVVASGSDSWLRYGIVSDGYALTADGAPWPTAILTDPIPELGGRLFLSLGGPTNDPQAVPADDQDGVDCSTPSDDVPPSDAQCPPAADVVADVDVDGGTASVTVAGERYQLSWLTGDAARRTFSPHPTQIDAVLTLTTDRGASMSFGWTAAELARDHLVTGFLFDHPLRLGVVADGYSLAAHDFSSWPTDLLTPSIPALGGQVFLAVGVPPDEPRAVPSPPDTPSCPTTTAST